MDGWVTGSAPRWFTYSKMVTHKLLTRPDLASATSLITTNAKPPTTALPRPMFTRTLALLSVCLH